MPQVAIVVYCRAKFPTQDCGSYIMGVLIHKTPEVWVYPEGNGESLMAFKQGSDFVKHKFKNISLARETGMGK